MSHLNKTINEDENIIISYIYKDTDWERTYIVYEDIIFFLFLHLMYAV